MTQHLHFDEAKVRAIVERIKTEREKHLNDEGASGVYSRLAVSIMPAFQIGFTEEVNRGASGREIAKAIAGLMANFLMTWVMSVVPNKEDQEQVAMAANFLMLEFADTMSFAMAGVADPQSEAGEAIHRFTVPPEQGGHA